MIRLADAGDGPAIGRVYCLSWQAGYRGIVPDEFLNGLTPENCAPGQISDTLVYYDAENVLGLVSFGASREGPQENFGEVYAIYVIPEVWGRGVGSELLGAALAAIRNSGYAGAYLWVLRDNARARRFYEKMGMRAAGDERTISIGGKPLGETKYALIFSDARPTPEGLGEVRKPSHFGPIPQDLAESPSGVK